MGPQIFVSNELHPNSYITDCGDPSYLLPSPLECKSCTMCCNSEKKCQETDTWRITVSVLALIIALMLPVFLIATVEFILRSQKKKKVLVSLGFDKREIVCACDFESVYWFVFSDNNMALFMYHFTAAMQIWLFAVYLQASNTKLNENTDWQFSFKCLGNSLDCYNDNSVSTMGWIILAIVLFFYLGSDIVLSFLQIRKSLLHMNLRFFYSGFILLSLTVLTAVTSVVYNVALAESNTDLVTSAVILLFINDLDEKCLHFLKSLSPSWCSMRLQEAKINLLEISKKSALDSCANPVQNEASVSISTANIFDHPTSTQPANDIIYIPSEERKRKAAKQYSTP